MAQEVFVGQMNCQRGVVRVGGLVLRLAQHLKGVRQGLEAPDQLVVADVVRDL